MVKFRSCLFAFSVSPEVYWEWSTWHCSGCVLLSLGWAVSLSCEHTSQVTWLVVVIQCLSACQKTSSTLLWKNTTVDLFTAAYDAERWHRVLAVRSRRGTLVKCVCICVMDTQALVQLSLYCTNLSLQQWCSCKFFSDFTFFLQYKILLNFLLLEIFRMCPTCERKHSKSLPDASIRFAFLRLKVPTHLLK